MKITQLTAENVKKIKVVQIKPDGSLVIIGGQNEAGKSSVLDSIMYAIAGEKHCPGKPIRDGESKASVEVVIDGAHGSRMIVTRKWTKKGSYLTITNGDGVPSSSPQKILDELYNSLSFDPLAFSRMSPKQQTIALQELTGLDFTEIDNNRKAAYDKRHNVNSQATTLNGQLRGLPLHFDAPDKPVDVAELMERRKVLETERENYTQLQRTLKEARHAIADQDNTVEALKEELDVAERELKVMQELQRFAEKEATKVAQPDFTTIDEQINSASELNTKHADNARRVEVGEQVKALEKTSKGYTKEIETCDKNKADAIGNADMPIDGLSFNENVVEYKGIPFDQCSSAQALRVSVAMGLAMNPKLRVLLIRDGSLLDDSNLAIISEMAEKNDAQVWIERVGEGEECSVIMEDGHVKT